MQSIHQNVQTAITEIDKSTAKLETLGTGIREALQKAANTIRVFRDKPGKEYGKKRISKMELLKKPLQTKRKLLSGILNYTDIATEKIEKLSSDVKQYQSTRTDQEVECVSEEEIGNSAVFSGVAEKEYQYGEEVFEKNLKKTDNKLTINGEEKDKKIEKVR